jgi:hypothetical protein
VFFAGGFAKLWWQIVVFLWLVCGEMRGKDGLLTVTFRCREICHDFQVYFVILALVDARAEHFRRRPPEPPQWFRLFPC